MPREKHDAAVTVVVAVVVIVVAFVAFAFELSGVVEKVVVTLSAAVIAKG